MNVESLVLEGITNVKESRASEIWNQVVLDPLFVANVMNMSESTIQLALMSVDYESLSRIAMMLNVAFEIGRLTGRSEIVRETMGE